MRDGGSAMWFMGRRRDRSRTVISVLLAAPMIAAAGIWYVLGASGQPGSGPGVPSPSSGESPRLVAVGDLKVGDCFSAPGEEGTIPAAFGPPVKVWLTPCGRLHFGEVYAVAELHGATFPGGQLEAYRECEKRRSDYALDDWAIPDNAWPGHLEPAPGGTQGPGPAMTICTFDIRGGATSSLRQDRSRLKPQQRAYLEAEAPLLVDRALAPGTAVQLAPEAYRAWLGDCIRSAGSALQVLDSSSWDGRAAQPVAERAQELRQQLQLLRAAQQATDTKALERQVYTVENAMRATAKKVAVRTALGLPDAPPGGPGGDQGSVPSAGPVRASSSATAVPL